METSEECDVKRSKRLKRGLIQSSCGLFVIGLSLRVIAMEERSKLCKAEVVIQSQNSNFGQVNFYSDFYNFRLMLRQRELAYAEHTTFRLRNLHCSL